MPVSSRRRSDVLPHAAPPDNDRSMSMDSFHGIEHWKGRASHPAPAFLTVAHFAEFRSENSCTPLILPDGTTTTSGPRQIVDLAQNENPVGIHALGHVIHSLYRRDVQVRTAHLNYSHMPPIISHAMLATGMCCQSKICQSQNLALHPEEVTCRQRDLWAVGDSALLPQLLVPRNNFRIGRDRSCDQHCTSDLKTTTHASAWSAAAVTAQAHLLRKQPASLWKQLASPEIWIGRPASSLQTAPSTWLPLFRYLCDTTACWETTFDLFAMLW